MPKKKLTHQFIKSLEKPEKPIAYYDEKQSGLILRLSKAGTKSFSYRYQFHGKKRRFKIGTFPGMSLAEARDTIHELKANIKDGIDPQGQREERRSQPEPKKFEYLANQFKKKHIPTLKESTQKSYTERINNQMLPAFKGMAIKNMSRGVIIELLEEIAYERESPYQSNRIRAILSSIFSFGVQRELAEYNPVKTIKPLGKEQKRDRVLTKKEIKKLWLQFTALKEPTSSVFRLLLLLGQRKGETCQMKWEQLNGDVWTIPKGQTKADRKHYVPLPPMALDIINSLKNDSEYVFESPKYKGEPVYSIHSSFYAATDRAKLKDVRIHDLRRTAATCMAELGAERTILGKVLNHKGLAGDNQVTARYDRYSYMDEKRKILNRWSHKLQQIVEGKETKITKMG